ncbi:hypothetical protein B6259_02835 [Ruminococcaceae bacterium CPB6]|jgi:hypothetical protein|nr:hypothetical protein B6259_02835 [Ruminococcaceae bacterium CPB6]
MLRSFISAAVEKGFKDIERDPKRSVRQLVDLGTYFAKGRFQRYFFDIFGEMLHNENSSYYKWIHDLVVNADQKQLKTFGMNLAYNGWTVGARTVRTLEKAAGYNVPWTLIFHFSKSGLFTPQMLDRAIQQGEELGIYSYMIFSNGEEAPMELVPVLENHPDCAFVLFCENRQVSDELITVILQVKNTLLCLHCDDGFLQTAKQMNSRHCFFAAWYPYDDTFQKAFYQRELLPQVLQARTPFFFFIALRTCSSQKRREVRSEILKCRQTQSEPVFCIDFYADLAFIDGVISSDPCVLTFNADGISEAAPGCYPMKARSLRDHTLQELLTEVLPHPPEASAPRTGAVQ